jgi:hypothetical protein
VRSGFTEVPGWESSVVVESRCGVAGIIPNRLARHGSIRAADCSSFEMRPESRVQFC